MAFPDLRVASFTLNNTSVTNSGRITFNYTISNIGTSTAAASFAGLYLSSDSTITTSDQLVEVLNTPSLGSGLVDVESNKPWDLSTLLTALAPGNYWLGLIADYNNGVSEGNESNNASAAVEFTVTAPLPDLTVSISNVSPTSLSPGSTLSLNYTISNTGTGSAGNFLTGFYLSPDQSFGDANDVAVDLVSTTGLAANSSTSGSISFTVPASLGAGPWYVAAMVDHGGGFPNGQITESNESNNTSNIASITLNAPSPVVTIAGSVTQATEGGQPLIFNLNLNQIASQNVTVSFQLGGTATASDYQVQSGSQVISGSIVIPAGSSSAAISIYPLSDNLVEGDESITVQLTGASGATLGTNLTASGTIHDATPSLPDLTVSISNVSPTSLSPGSTLSLNYTISNNGTGSAGNFLTGLYLSPDQSFGDSNDVAVDLVSTTGLAGNSSTSGSISFTVPASLGAGPWYVAAIVDRGGGFPNGQITESNENNNTSNIASITLNAPFPVVTVAGSVMEATEGGQPLIFNVNLNQIASQNVTVSFQLGGTASASDYRVQSGSQVISGSIVIPAGSSSAPISIYPLSDNLVEGDESVSVQLTGASGATLGSNLTATGTIHDAAPPAGPTFSISNAGVVAEGNNAVFTVTMNGTISAPYTIWYSTFASTASAKNGDYPNTLVDQPLTFTPGGSNTQQITIPTFVTQNAHPDAFSVGLQKTQFGEAFTTGSGTIVSNTGGPTFSISDAGNVTEGNNAVFTVTMSGSINTPYTIWYSTFAGTASVAHGDYPGTFVDQSLTFTPGGSNTQQITIPTFVTQNSHPDSFSVGLQSSQHGGAFTSGVATIVAPANTPPAPTVAPLTSQFPTSLLTDQGSAFYRPLLQQTSPNLNSYLTTATSISTPELASLSANYKQNLTTLNGVLDSESAGLTIAGDGLEYIDLAKNGLKVSPAGLLEATASTYLSTPEAKSLLTAPVDQAAGLGVDAASIYTSCAIAVGTAEVPVLDVVTATGCALAAVSGGVDLLNAATSAAVGNDPPDPNYQQVFVPPPVPVDPMPATGLPAALATAAQLAMTDIDQATQWMYAINTTENRYATALAAGDPSSASMQYAAFLNYLGLYMGAAQAASNDLAQLSSDLQSNSLGTQLVTTQELATALGDVQAAGSSGIHALLASLGFTDSEIQVMDQQVAAETVPATLPTETPVQTLANLASKFSSVAPLVIEADGSTSLAQGGSNYFIVPPGVSSIAELKYGGAPVVAGQFGAGIVPIGAEATASGYEIAWKATGADQYWVWNLDSNGNDVGHVFNGVPGNTPGLEALEPSFQQDLNSDGTIGPTVSTTVIESFGQTSLTQVGNNYFLYAKGTTTGPELKYGGVPVVAGQFGAGIVPIGAEATASGYEIAWKATGADQYWVWNLDSKGNDVGHVFNGVPGNTPGLEALEPSFQQDLNGDGTISVPAAPQVQTVIPPDQDIWTTSVFSFAPGGGGPGGGLADDLLKVGGWGDLYYSLMKFDLTGLPTHATSVELRLFDISSNGGTPTSMDLYRITQDWNWQTQGTGSDRLRLWWADQPSAAAQTTSLPAPGVGSYYYIDITDLYNQWQAGTLPNFGIELRPTSNNNNFDIFGSSRNATQADQPALVITTASGAQAASASVQLSAISQTIVDGGSFEASGLSADSISFAGPTGTLILDDSAEFVGKISGLTGQDQIDLRDIGFGANTTLLYAANSSNTGGILAVSDGAHGANLFLAGQYTTANFTMVSDNAGGTLLYDPPTGGSPPTASAPRGTLKLCVDPAADGFAVLAPGAAQIGDLALAVPAPILSAMQSGQHLGRWT